MPLKLFASLSRQYHSAVGHPVSHHDCISIDRLRHRKRRESLPELSKTDLTFGAEFLNREAVDFESLDLEQFDSDYFDSDCFDSDCFDSDCFDSDCFDSDCFDSDSEYPLCSSSPHSPYESPPTRPFTR